MYILRTTGSWFVRFVVQPSIYSFQGSDRLILPRTAVRVKAIHPTTDFVDFVGRGFTLNFITLSEDEAKSCDAKKLDLSEFERLCGWRNCGIANTFYL